MLEGERVVITGGGGFIGSHLSERLAPANEVVVLDDMSVGKLSNLAQVKGRVDVVQGSVLDPRAVKKAFSRATIVFHLAALTSVPESVKQPLAYAEANVMGTINVLVAAREIGARRVVFASTCAIYGASKGPLSEDLPPSPISPYAVTKLACEYFCRTMSERDGLQTVSLRLFNAYGPRQSASSPYASVVAKFCDAAVRTRPATLYGDGSQTRDFVYVADVAEAFERAAEAHRAGGQVINVGSGEDTSIRDLLRIVGEVAGKPLEVIQKPPRPGDIQESRADTRRTQSLLGFTAKTSLRQGLGATLASRTKSR